MLSFGKMKNLTSYLFFLDPYVDSNRYPDRSGYPGGSRNPDPRYPGSAGGSDSRFGGGQLAGEQVGLKIYIRVVCKGYSKAFL